MATRIALNGFGRIGRTIFKVIKDRKLPLEVVVLNDLTTPSELAYLLKYDSIHGVWPHEVQGSENELIVDGKPVKCLKITDPAPRCLLWAESVILRHLTGLPSTINSSSDPWTS